MEKKLIQNADEWTTFIAQFHHFDGFDTSSTPEKYPCVFVWETRDVFNQNCDDCTQEFVYPDDFVAKSS